MLYPAELLPRQVALEAREGGTKNDRIRKLKDENSSGQAREYALTFPQRSVIFQEGSKAVSWVH